MSKRILVTGAKGQLGNEIRALAGGTGLQFIYTDIEELDLGNREAVTAYVKESKPDFIINCAAYTAVDLAEKEKESAFRVNRDAVQHLALAMEALPSCRMVHISTDYVFPGTQLSPLKETDPTGPLSNYGHSKLAGELLISDHPAAMIIRTSWLYSVYGKNFVKSMIGRMQAGQDLGIVYDQVGTPTNAEDLAEAILKMIEGISAGTQVFVPGIFHYSNEGLSSWYDFAIEICRQIGCKVQIRPIETHEYPLPASRPAFSVLNKTKIKEVYALEIPHWRDSLEKCIKKLGNYEQ